MINSSKLNQHKREKKKLIPPIMTLNPTFTSRKKDRLPEMLWAILFIGKIERAQYLELFRKISDFVVENWYSDVTLSWIKDRKNDTKEKFINLLISSNNNTKAILSPLLLFEDLPWIEFRKKYLDTGVSKDDMVHGLAESLFYTLEWWSEESTDIRWLRVICLIKSWKIRFNNNVEDAINNILSYPNVWDIKSVESSIRSMEMIPLTTSTSEWPKIFWKESFKLAPCHTWIELNPEIEKNRIKEIEESAKFSHESFEKYASKLTKIIPYYDNLIMKKWRVLSNEILFWMSVYAIQLFLEFSSTISRVGIIWRLSMRCLVEIYITLSYLIYKDKKWEPIRNEYYNYWLWQLKLIYSKYEEQQFKSWIVNTWWLNDIVNRELRDEYIPINLWNRDKLNLRDMSIEAWLKDIYDKYYDYCSWYMHCTRWAMREASFDMCMTPLHGVHNTFELSVPLISDVIFDASEILEKIIGLLKEHYPDVV